MINLADLRREYMQKGLRRCHLTADPLELFERWLQQACDAGLPDASAMSVATVDHHGQPYQRLVLLKQYDQQGFVFYTNLDSRKAIQLAVNPKVSLLFPWHALDRQVIINGCAMLLPRAAVSDYFHSRPRDSQLAAWASKQSTIIDSRQTLENSFLHWQQQFSQGEVPLPDFWGGIQVWAESLEFWQGRAHRLHDRFHYQRRSPGWEIARLAP